MNWAALAAICSIVAVLATIIGAAYTHGKLTQRVDTTQTGLKDLATTTALVFQEHKETLKEHRDKIEGLEVKTGKLEEWKAGFSTGVTATSSKG